MVRRRSGISAEVYLGNLTRLLDASAEVGRPNGVMVARDADINGASGPDRGGTAIQDQWTSWRRITDANWKLYFPAWPDAPVAEGLATSRRSRRHKEEHILKEFRTLASQHLPIGVTQALGEVELAAFAQTTTEASSTLLLDCGMNHDGCSCTSLSRKKNSKTDSVVWAVPGERKRCPQPLTSSMLPSTSSFQIICFAGQQFSRHFLHSGLIQLSIWRRSSPNSGWTTCVVGDHYSSGASSRLADCIRSWASDVSRLGQKRCPC